MMHRPTAIGLEGTNLSSHALPYGAPPFTYEGSRLLSIAFTTSPEILRAMVPEPLTPNPDHVMSILVADHHITRPLVVSYYEAMLAVPVSHDGCVGTYLPVLYLDKVLPIIGGREIWGFSKVEAEIHLSAGGSTVTATVVREGTTLIDMAAHLGEPVVPIPEMPNDPIFNLKLIPSVTQGAQPDVKQLTSTVGGDVKIHVVRGGTGTLALASLASDPLGAIPVVEIVGAGYQEQDFVLGYGEVVFDYLRPQR